METGKEEKKNSTRIFFMWNFKSQIVITLVASLQHHHFQIVIIENGMKIKSERQECLYFRRFLFSFGLCIFNISSLPMKQLGKECDIEVTTTSTLFCPPWRPFPPLSFHLNKEFYSCIIIFSWSHPFVPIFTKWGAPWGKSRSE